MSFDSFPFFCLLILDIKLSSDSVLEPSGLKLYIIYKRFLVIGASGKSKPYNLHLLLIFSLSLIFILFCLASKAS